METLEREIGDLELALLRRGVHELAAGRERCARCDRTPLIGERVYLYGSGAMLCELCRALERQAPDGSRTVHGPEYGHTLRLADRHAA